MIKKLTMLLLAGAMALGCTDSDEGMDSTVVAGDPVFAAVNPGNGRAEFVWQPNDGSATYTEIYANNELLTSAYFPAGTTDVARIISLPSGDYSFYIVNLKADGTKSEKSSTISATVYDDSFGEGLQPSEVESVMYDDQDGGIITWKETENLVALTVFYEDEEGNQYSLYTDLAEGYTAKYPEADINTPFTYISHYVPVEGAIDTYVSGVSEVQKFANDMNEDGQTMVEVNSLEAMIPYFSRSNVHVTLKQGEYRVTPDDIKAGKYDFFPDVIEKDYSQALFLIEGNNSTYDFNHSPIYVETECFNVKKYEFNHLHFLGNWNTVKNYIQYDDGEDEDYPAGHSTNVVLDGSYNTVDNIEIHSKGSYPFGYGELFGKGSGYVIKHFKHCCILIRGNYNHVMNSRFDHKAYGHVLYMQGAWWPMIENCEMEGAMGSTDWVLEDTRSKDDPDSQYGFQRAFDVGYKTTWGYTVQPGFIMCLTEDCLRTYKEGSTIINGVRYVRDTGGAYARDCHVKNTRSGVSMVLGSGTTVQAGVAGTKEFPAPDWYNPSATGVHFVERITTIGCDNGLGIRSGCTISDCYANAQYGPALSMAYDTDSNITADITLLPFEKETTIYGHRGVNGSAQVAHIRGSGHKITIKTDDSLIGDGSVYGWNRGEDGHNRDQEELVITLGGDLNTIGGQGSMNDDGSWNDSDENDPLRGSTITNYSSYKILIDNNTSGLTVKSAGEIVDNGSGNTTGTL